MKKAMEDEAQDSEPMKEVIEEAPDIETKLKGAIRERVGHFSQQADSMTLEGVRRLLEKDLGLEKWALDAHKRFVKQYLQECFDAAAAEIKSKNSGENGEKVVPLTGEESTKLHEECNSLKEVKEPSLENEKMEGSPILGLVTWGEPTNCETVKTLDVVNEDTPSEDTIKKAIKKRASYIRANSETVSMKGARRLLEEDLKLDKNALDPFKDLIAEQINKVFQSPEDAQITNGVKNRRVKSDSHSKTPRKVSSEGSSDVSDSDNEEIDEDEVRSKKKNAPKGKTQNSEGLKKRKISAKETKTPVNKRSKPVEIIEEESSDAKDDGNSSESSAEKPVKKKREVVSTQTYGKRVEHLKSIIKACAMTVPPSVYKRAKQAPESKREASLIKELEEMLGREGLSTNPSEKEIKEVRKRKERAKELEGIDMSNIVPSSRRRSTFNFATPPKPTIPVNDGEEDGDSDEDGDDDDDSDDDDENEDNEASNSGDASEGVNEDVEDESD